jgi:hypothetical protein
MQDWALLRAELELLADRLLPAQPQTAGGAIPPTPNFDDSVGIHAFVVLAHGAVEEYLEALFISHARRVDQSGSKLPARVASSTGISFSSHGEALSYQKRNIEQTLKLGEGVIRAKVRTNHGIKERNIKGLAEHAGVEWPSFEAACGQQFTFLDTLGAKRGAVAHLSASTASASQTIYPEEARQWVSDALAAVRKIDRYLTISILLLDS